MYYKLEEKELERIKKASEMTCTDYELLGNFIPVESLVTMVEDLLVEIDHLEQELGDLEHDLQENYKPIKVAEMYGISDRDFYC